MRVPSPGYETGGGSDRTTTRRMKLLAFALLTLLGSARAQEAPDLVIRVDPRVEVLSTVFRLAGYGEYGQGRIASYAAAVDEVPSVRTGNTRSCSTRASCVAATE